ncbi:hypothetical protein FB45DRAFT_478110 [Roridomyces roridus]|uniref:Uncharacterized protein n=1 Tax=Roridomyces roridus TaxID=1738132 RepID=A0AAD7FNV2_9AGAR|nr:hypothetical protein FB45DRAFT_478110 [Roridomyces roridus]
MFTTIFSSSAIPPANATTSRLRERCGFTLWISFAPAFPKIQPKGEIGPSHSNIPRRKRSSVVSISDLPVPVPVPAPAVLNGELLPMKDSEAEGSETRSGRGGLAKKDAAGVSGDDVFKPSSLYAAGSPSNTPWAPNSLCTLACPRLRAVCL